MLMDFEFNFRRIAKAWALFVALLFDLFVLAFYSSFVSQSQHNDKYKNPENNTECGSIAIKTMKTNLTEVFAIFLALAKRRAEIINQCIILHYVRNMAHRFAAHTHIHATISFFLRWGLYLSYD